MDDVWHATQEQAAPPSIHQGGAYTICAVWATFVRGYERRRPTCPTCLRACERDEGVSTPTSPATLATTLGASRVETLKTKPSSDPVGAHATAREVAKLHSDKGPPDTIETAVAHIDRALQEPHRTRAHSLFVGLCSYVLKLPPSEHDRFSPSEGAAIAIRVGQAIGDGHAAAMARVDEVTKLLDSASLCRPALVEFVNDLAGKKIAAARAKHAAEAAEFDAKLNALVEATKKSRR